MIYDSIFEPFILIDICYVMGMRCLPNACTYIYIKTLKVLYMCAKMCGNKREYNAMLFIDN